MVADKVCFMFGHSDTPDDALAEIEAAAEWHYLHHGVRTFVAGRHGRFDWLAAMAVKRLKERYSDVQLQLLLTCHPGEMPEGAAKGYDSSFFPNLEGVPPRFRIARANREMIRRADTIICYVRYIGNARKLLLAAEKRQGIPIANVATSWRSHDVSAS